MVHPITDPIAAISFMAAEQKARTSGSSSTWDDAAPVIAEIGFIVRLPHSLYQMSWRIEEDSATSKRAVRSNAAIAETRSDAVPSGSPTMMR